MAEASPLEQIAKNASQPPQQEKKEENKEVGTLESGLKEITNAGKNVLSIGAEVAFPFMFSGQNRTNAMVNAYPLSLGARVDDIMAKKPIDLKSNIKSAKESLVGTLIANPLAYMFRYIEVIRQYVTNYAGAIPGGAAAVGALALGQAVFIGAYTGLNHIIQNFSFKGLYNKFKNDYPTAIKNTWKYVLPLSAINPLFLAPYGITVQLAYGALMSFLFRLVIKAKEAKFSNLVYAMNPIPYISGGLTATSKLAKSVIYNPLKALYEIGSGYAKKAAESVKPIAPSPAAAGARA